MSAILRTGHRLVARAAAGVCLLAPCLVIAQTGRPAATDPKALDARLAALHAEAATLAGEQQSLLGRLRQLQVARDTRLVELERTNASLTRVAGEVDGAGRRVAAIEQELRAITPEISDRLVRTYKLLPLGYDRLLLSLDEARSIDRAARIVGVIARRDRTRLEQFQQLRSERQNEVRRLQREGGQLESLRQRLVTEEAALAAAGAAQATLLRSVRERREMNAQLVDELTAARDRLDRSVSTLGSTTAALPGRSSAGLVAGGLDWPVPGRIEARFGREASSRFGTVIVRNGVEIGAQAGAAVRAAEAGRVAFADTFTGFGRVVILDHGGKSYTLYGHLAAIDVNKDQRVERGRVLGAVGTAPTGAASLYFEVRIDGRPVDPVQWLKR
jgi:septal ring factor EnvC (AmiA/AmiB activator)